MDWLNEPVSIDVLIGLNFVILSVIAAVFAAIDDRAADGHRGPRWLRRAYPISFCYGIVFGCVPYVTATGYTLLCLAAAIGIWTWWGVLGVKPWPPQK